MSNILYDLYNGLLYPAEQFSPKLNEYLELRKQSIDGQDSFIDKIDAIDPELKRQFMQIMDHAFKGIPLEMAEVFCQGFRLGGQMMLEIMEKG